MKTFEENGKRIALHIAKEEMQKGLNFYTKEDDFIQVGTWGYDSGKELQPHIHNPGVQRQIDRTQEVVSIIQGGLKATILGEQGDLLGEVVAKVGDVLIMLGGGHGYQILTDDTMVLEVKNGPYVGPELDRRRINVSTNKSKQRK